jgi:hypothetical protein
MGLRRQDRYITAYYLYAIKHVIIITSFLLLRSTEKLLIANIVFELLAYLSEKERIKIKTRQAEGIATAKAKGVRFGRPSIKIPPGFSEEVRKCVFCKIKFLTWGCGQKLDFKTSQEVVHVFI